MYPDTPNSMIIFLSFSSKYAQVKLNLEIRLRTEKGWKYKSNPQN